MFVAGGRCGLATSDEINTGEVMELYWYVVDVPDAVFELKDRQLIIFIK